MKAASGVRSTLRLALLLGLVAAAVYAAFAWERLGRPSTDPHFVLQAEAFLHGQLELTRRPPHQNDWATIQELTLRDGRVVSGVYRTPATGGQVRRFETLQGKLLLIEGSEVRSSRTRTYVSFPSFPAVLMMPFVALFGERFSDVTFTVVLGGLNVALLFLLLELLVRRGYSGRSRRENAALALLFAFGTVHFWCSVLGQVWFTALVLGVTLSLLYLMAALDARHPLLAGLALGLGMATRTPLAFAALFFLFQAWPRRGEPAAGRSRVAQLALFSLPVLAVGVALAAMNVARFARPFEFGHTYLAGGTIERIAYHGLFGPNFVGTNLAAALILLPSLTAAAPYLHLSRHGMSVLLSTPPFLWLLAPRRPLDRLQLQLGLTAAAVAVPLLLYQNTGYIQYGYRFSLDVTPLLFLLLALGGRKLGWLFWAAAGVGVLVNGLGAVTFKRFESLYDDHFVGWGRLSGPT